MVLAIETWNLIPCILHIFVWTKDFVIASMKLTKKT